MAQVTEEPDPARELLPARTTRAAHRAVRHPLQYTEYHESLNNLTPEDVYLGRGQVILTQREKIKRATIETRRRLHRQAMAA